MFTIIVAGKKLLCCDNKLQGQILLLSFTASETIRAALVQFNAALHNQYGAWAIKQLAAANNILADAPIGIDFDKLADHTAFLDNCATALQAEIDGTGETALSAATIGTWTQAVNSFTTNYLA